MVYRSPVRKFANAPEGVGHRHKLTELVEESKNLISVSAVTMTAGIIVYVLLSQFLFVHGRYYLS